MTPTPPTESISRDRESKPGRKTFVLQVILPSIFGVLILAAGIVFLWQAGIGTASAWADTSLIFILIPWLCVGLVPLVLIGALWFGIFKLTAWLPEPLRKANEYIDQAGYYLRKGTDMAVKPMFVVKGAWAVVSMFFSGLASLFGLNNGDNYG